MSAKAGYDKLGDDIIEEMFKVLSNGHKSIDIESFVAWLRQRIETFVSPPENGMDIHEFRELGLLQEVNRRFFHPIGLALAVNTNKDGEPRIIDSLAYIIDSRDDPEGFCFGGLDAEEAARKAEAYDIEVDNRLVARMKLFHTDRMIGGQQPIHTMNMGITDE